MLSHYLAAQTYVYLEESFKETSTQMSVRRKGLSTIGKYEFGPYKIISGKAGWTTEKSKTGFISGDTRIESNSKSSFLFTGPQLDTITVNIAFSSITQINENYGFVFRMLTKWSLQEITENEVYMATISSSADTGIWSLVIAYPVEDEIAFNADITEDMISKFKGEIANPQTTIDIIPEYRWENGKPATVLKPVEGYKFVLMGETVAAVQTYPINKRFVWLRNDLSENLKFMLAAGATTFLVRSF